MGRDAAISGLAVITSVVGLAYAHNEAMTPSPSVARVWTGQLAALTPNEASQVEALSSAALVVPKARMILPPPPAKPVIRVKLTCDSADMTCIPMAPIPPRRAPPVIEAKPALVPPPPIQNLAPLGRETASAPQSKARAGLFSHFTPPDLASVGRPIARAAHAVVGWVSSAL